MKRFYFKKALKLAINTKLKSIAATITTSQSQFTLKLHVCPYDDEPNEGDIPSLICKLGGENGKQKMGKQERLRSWVNDPMEFDEKLDAIQELDSCEESDEASVAE